MEKIYLVQKVVIVEDAYTENIIKSTVAVFSTLEKANEFIDNYKELIMECHHEHEEYRCSSLIDIEVNETIIDNMEYKCPFCEEEEDETERIIQGLEKEVETLRKLLIEKTAENDKLSKSLSEERMALGKLREEYMDQSSLITKMEDVYYGNDEEIEEYFTHMEQDRARLMAENRQLRQENKELKAENVVKCIKECIMQNGHILIDM